MTEQEGWRRSNGRYVIMKARQQGGAIGRNITGRYVAFLHRTLCLDGSIVLMARVRSRFSVSVGWLFWQHSRTIEEVDFVQVFVLLL